MRHYDMVMVSVGQVNIGRIETLAHISRNIR